MAYLISALTLGLPGVANACGGLFCNQATPVDQTAEEIFFAVDHEAGVVTTHVKIMYEGPANEFAWIVPVPAAPELGVGTDALFTALSSRYRAVWNLQVDLGECGLDFVSSTGMIATTSAGGNGVHVIETNQVGPYDTVILEANDSSQLIGWLQDNGYDLPADLDPVLEPYVASGQAFVALKLSKDRDVGDLVPLAMTYPAAKAAIPIQLTSIAATPDMGLRVYVLGEHRSVPENYLHVTLNHMAIDWWTGGSNIDEVISAAADEAGGHAFFTDYAGSSQAMRGVLFDPDWSEAALASQPTAYDFVLEILTGQYPLDQPMQGVLEDHLPAEMVELPNWFFSLAYYGVWGYEELLTEHPFDAVAAAADVETEVLAPRRSADALFSLGLTLTRMTSSVSPSEMTKDPMFVFNPDMSDKDMLRQATETWECLEDESAFDAPRRLELTDGREVWIPSRNRLLELGQTEIEWLGELTRPAAAVISETSASGEPVVLVDNTADLWAALEDFDDGFGSKGCGCNSGGSAPTWALLLLGLVGLRRRATRTR